MTKYGKFFDAKEDGIELVEKKSTTTIKERVEAWYGLSYEEQLYRHEQVKRKIPVNIRRSVHQYALQLSPEERLELEVATKAEVYEAMVVDGWIHPGRSRSCADSMIGFP